MLVQGMAPVQWMAGAVAGGLLAATVPQGAATVTRAAGAAYPVAPAATAPPVKTVTKRFDVDGDRRADRVTLAPVRTGRYTLTVTTARGRTVRVPVYSTFAQDWGDNPWLNQGGIDPVPGAEIVLAVAAGDGVSGAVLTWRGGRNGRLINLPAPVSRGPEGVSRQWYWIGDEGRISGYKFWTAGGQRKALACAYVATGTATWSGSLTTSLWTGTGWREAAHRTVVVPEKTAQACAAFEGMTPAR